MILRLFAIIVLVASLVIGWAVMDYKAFIARPIVTDQSVVIDIAKGSSFQRITQTLLDHKLPVNKHWIKVLAYREGLINQLKAGEYELPVDTTPKAFLVLLSQGKVRQHTITFPEGWNFKEMRLALAGNIQLKQTLVGLSDAEILQKMGAKQTHPEGLFFPDSYRFEKHTTDLAILQRAYQKMQQILAAEWQNKSADLPLKDAYQALILASIVEKETGTAAERPIIAGVFIRRLQKGMRLQTDPTVIYGMGGNYQGNIRKKDLRELTPYNTYKIKGLPPTPIAMPGELAINAVLHPEQGNSLYFVAKGDGSHVFSDTLKAHNRAVNAFQRKHR
ncbi:MAG: endolytic transglycosylase MltG [Methyloprofundus sp.]|nr:endolytic transglycosylase MltG [Methyloprofundus sp.]